MKKLLALVLAGATMLCAGCSQERPAAPALLPMIPGPKSSRLEKISWAWTMPSANGLHGPPNR